MGRPYLAKAASQVTSTAMMIMKVAVAYPSPPQGTEATQLQSGLNNIKTDSTSVANQAAALAGKFKSSTEATKAGQDAKAAEVKALGDQVATEAGSIAAEAQAAAGEAAAAASAANMEVAKVSASADAKIAEA